MYTDFPTIAGCFAFCFLTFDVLCDEDRSTLLQPNTRDCAQSTGETNANKEPQDHLILEREVNSGSLAAVDLAGRGEKEKGARNGKTRDQIKEIAIAAANKEPGWKGRAKRSSTPRWWKDRWFVSIHSLPSAPGLALFIHLDRDGKVLAVLPSE